MPNIEIRGYPAKRSRALRDRIETILTELGLAHDAITSRVNLTARNTETKMEAPYIRICCTDSLEIRQIVEGMKRARIGEDVEVLLLSDFIPADQMR